jgi:hypothetical protein
MFGISLSFEASGMSDPQGGAKTFGVPQLLGVASVRPQLPQGLRTSDSLRNRQDKYVKDCYVSFTLVDTSQGRMGQ